MGRENRPGVAAQPNFIPRWYWRCFPNYFGRTAWNSDFAVDSTSSAAA
jgi:hypothetical protein